MDEAIEELPAALRDNVTIFEIDVTNDSSITRAVDEIIRKEGRLDCLVNNAGNPTRGLLLEFP